jgi:DNA-binding protein Alba
VAVKRFLKDEIEINNITIDSEEFQNKEGKEVRVSTIEILLKKK